MLLKGFQGQWSQIGGHALPLRCSRQCVASLELWTAMKARVKLNGRISLWHRWDVCARMLRGLISGLMGWCDYQNAAHTQRLYQCNHRICTFEGDYWALSSHSRDDEELREEEWWYRFGDHMAKTEKIVETTSERSEAVRKKSNIKLVRRNQRYVVDELVRLKRSITIAISS